MDIERSALLPVPLITIRCYKDAHSTKMIEYCQSKPVCRIKNLIHTLNIDLSLFSSKYLKDTQPNHKIEVRVQPKPLSKSKQFFYNKNSWAWESRPSISTIKKYAHYQALTFIETHHITRTYQSRQSKSLTKQSSKRISFGTNVDLSSPDIWPKQLKELSKLPNFVKVDCPKSNMLNHIGHDVLGVNTVQLYMKIPGCRTPGHQENNNFCSININVGPGLCEWFCVPSKQWPIIQELCKKHCLDFLRGSWWPELFELSANKIELIHFIQEPGDLVYINSGTVHWVQSNGWCNNIAWNVGPFTSQQYSSALERYESNKITNFKSIVPMLQLTWNLAINRILIEDKQLCYLVLKQLKESLKFCENVRYRVINQFKIEIKPQKRLAGDLAHYCEICYVETLNILFVQKSYVHCMKCALKLDAQLKDFVVLEEYNIKFLRETLQKYEIIIGN